MAVTYTNIASPFNGILAEVTIAASGSLSEEIELGGRVPVAIRMPGVWTTANLTFSSSPASGSTFLNKYDDAGAEYTVAAGASREIPLNPNAFLGGSYLKLRSGTSGTPVNQAVAATLGVVLADLF